MTLAHLPTIHTLSAEMLGLKVSSDYTNFASAVFPGANRALLLPLHIVKKIPALKLFCGNGAAVSGNIDMGLYTADPTPQRIVSIGSTAHAGTDVLQEFNTTDVDLVPGYYYMAIAMDNITGTLSRVSFGTALCRYAGCVQMANAFPLPATITSASFATGYLPLVGLLQGRTLL